MSDDIVECLIVPLALLGMVMVTYWTVVVRRAIRILDERQRQKGES